MNSQTESSPSPCYTYRFGTAEFDEARFELRVGGLPVEVEHRALEVLAYLLRHAGEVVTKEELLREVWAGRVTVDKVLPNAVTKLRRALGEANAERLLTQARVGYRLDGTVARMAVGGSLTSRLDLAPGQPVPGRANFTLLRQLGATHGSEVWLAEQARTRVQRVYKFGADGDRLRALKREVTLSRVLREGVDERGMFVDIVDWNFETPPFFLECEYGGESLLDWAPTRLPALAQEERIGLFLQIADAIAAAHAVGILHKDLKPANVLIAADAAGWHIRLTDFGSGRLLDPERIDALGITRLGLTITQNVSADSTSGTPLYIAPEVFAGHTPTVQSDVYALGILLYQLLCGQLTKPMTSGWEQDIDDALLREDIALATDGNPQRRLAGVAELAARLRARGQRREHALHAERVEQRARIAHEALARSRARRPYLIALIAALALSAGVAFALYRSATQARNAAQRELERAGAINRFLNEDLIGRSNPLVVAKGQSASLKDVLLGARDRIGKRFASQPLTEASVRTSLATLLNMIELLPEAEAEARQALALYEREEGAASLDALKARTLFARLLTRTSKFDESLTQLQTLDRLTAGSQDPYTRYLVASAWGIYDMNRGDYAKALPLYRSAIPLLRQTDPGNVTLRDSMRMDLISALTQTGQTQEARKEGEDLIAEVDARGDDNGLVVAFARAAVARTYTLEGDLPKAEAQLLDAQKTIVQRLGEDHTRNLMVLSDLFDIEVRRADWPKALDYAQRVHDGFRTKFGEDHNFSNITLVNLGQVLYESGQAGEAETRLRTAHDKLAKQFSADNPQSQIAAFWLGAADLELGRLDDASVLLDSLGAQALESTSADGLWQFRLDALRGTWLARRGRAREAEPLLRLATAGLEKGGEIRSRVYANAKQALANAPAGTTRS
jgi:non-specific serine/threonine protein kinase